MSNYASPAEWVYAIQSIISNSMECLLQLWNAQYYQEENACSLKKRSLFPINSSISCKYGITNKIHWPSLSLYNEAIYEEAAKSKPSKLVNEMVVTILSGYTIVEAWVFRIQRKSVIK